MRMRLIVPVAAGVVIFAAGLIVHSGVLGTVGAVALILGGAYADWRATVAKARLIVAADELGKSHSTRTDSPARPE